MGSCQNYGPFLGTLNNRCRIIIGTRKGTMILTTTHMKTWSGKKMENAFARRICRPSGLGVSGSVRRRAAAQASQVKRDSGEGGGGYTH